MLSAALVAATALAATPPTRVEVKSMPGYPGPLPSKMYSGFVNAGTPPSGVGEMYFHYIGFQAEENPATAPTVIWYNGGPGASSLFGLFQELGPLYLNEYSEKSAAYNKTGIPEPLYNPSTWSKRFNLFAIDSPAPVGFSYCTQDGPAGKGTSCGPWNDSAVFKANHKVLTNLLNDVFPEYLENDLYLTGESYAGIYVPGIMNEIIEEPKGLKLKGVAVGDGCMGNDVGCKGPYYDVRFFGGHGQVSNALQKQIWQHCPKANLCSGHLDERCKGLIKEMNKQIGGYFVYDLYDDCPSNMISRLSEFKSRHAGRSRHMFSKYSGAVNEYACSGTAMPDYFAREDFRNAIGVPVNDYFFNADNGAGFNYSSTVNDVRPFYKNAISKGLRILNYEGDSDACGLDSAGFLQDTYTAFWPSLGLTQNEAWRPWTTDGKSHMGGYVMEWGHRQASFLTIRGSGHMVPLNKPVQAAAFINAFVFNEEFPAYTGSQ